MFSGRSLAPIQSGQLSHLCRGHDPGSRRVEKMRKRPELLFSAKPKWPSWHFLEKPKQPRAWAPPHPGVRARPVGSAWGQRSWEWLRAFRVADVPMETSVWVQDGKRETGLERRKTSCPQHPPPNVSTGAGGRGRVGGWGQGTGAGFELHPDFADHFIFTTHDRCGPQPSPGAGTELGGQEHGLLAHRV